VRVAIAIWRERVSPVFDVARQVLVVEVPWKRWGDWTMEELGELSERSRVTRLSELNIELLVCGAISSPLWEMLMDAKIDVQPHVSGSLSQVLQAVADGRINDPIFRMPGCVSGRQGRRRRGSCTNGEGAGRLFQRRTRGQQTDDSVKETKCLDTIRPVPPDQDL